MVQGLVDDVYMLAIDHAIYAIPVVQLWYVLFHFV